MASNPPSSCCYQGSKHEGAAQGKTIKLPSGVEAYVATPESDKSNKKGIILLTDVIGHVFINAQLQADQLAANGYTVVMPDLFYGDPVQLNRPEGFDLQTWLRTGGPKGNHLPASVDPIIEETLKAMRDPAGQFACDLVGAVGYCFGAKYVVRFMGGRGKGNEGIDVGYVAHPSFVEKEELEKITGPFSIAAAETDAIFTVEQRHDSETILQGTKQPWQICLYSGVSHGFGVRGDPTKAVERFAKESAFLQAVRWFEEFLK